MDHSESSIRHDITAKTGSSFDENVKKMLDFVKTKVNPFTKPVASVPLYNFVNNEKAYSFIHERLLKLQKSEEDVHKKIVKKSLLAKKENSQTRSTDAMFITEDPKGTSPTSSQTSHRQRHLLSSK